MITLGAAISLTGKYAQNGINTKNGYDLAVRRINEKGGVEIGGKRYSFSVKYYDDESTPARSTELAERLIEQDGIKYMLGPYSSGLTQAIMPILEKHNVPMVEGNAAAREFFAKGYRYIFAVLSTSEQYLAGAIDLTAKYAHKLGKKPHEIRVALAMENDPFTRDVRAGVLEGLRKYKMRVVIDDQLPPEVNDVSVTLTKIKALKPDMLLVSGHEKGALTAVRQIDASKVYVPVIALTHCDSARLIEKAAEASENVFCVSQWHRTLNYTGATFGTPRDFAKLFEETYGHTAPYQAAQSAAAVLVFADAFARAQDLDAVKVRDAIAETDIETFYGKIKFHRTGWNVAKPMLLCQVIRGEYVIVAPAQWAVREPIIPKPPEEGG